MDKLFPPTLYGPCDYLYMLGLQLNHVSKSGPMGLVMINDHWMGNKHSKALLGVTIDDCIALWNHSKSTWLLERDIFDMEFSDKIHI